jgi:hydrogenase expression/formation protein HypC
MRITELQGKAAVAEVDGVTRQIRVDLLPDVSLGDYVLVHAGLAIARVDEEDTQATLSLLRGDFHEVQ